ncbi:MAG TPA: pilus assembly protein [Planctomycetes bacterium]|nr:pilus assembly protein [Fuerstiella sp.]HIK94602.1 pilus assembly protein [Planctomycetota bacterium]
MRISSHNRNRRNVATSNRSGVAVLEAAVILPMMLILVLGTIEMGSALRASTIMQSSVREAGRLANMNWSDVVEDGDTPNAKIERDIRNYVTASGLPGSALTVSIVYADGQSIGLPFDISDEDNALQMMKIEISMPYSAISLFPSNHMAGTDVRAFLILRAGLGGGALSS